MNHYVYICDDEQASNNLNLTYLKTYEILRFTRDDTFVLINDVNNITYVMGERFIPLSEYRKNKINNILKCLND